MTRRTLHTARRTALVTALALTAGLTLAACDSGGGAPRLKVSESYMPQPVTQDMAGAFFVVKNTGDTADKLTSVTSDLSKDVTMHKTVGTKMEQVSSLKVPANGELRLARGGYHLMFMGLKHKPVKGDKVTLELHFATSGPVRVDVPVKATDYVPQK
ncbi:copper chaperone PCu(A)C [Streptomyces natalensis]|uniref:Copper chaperone n=1 Tax=Streptomyces natalensis ATCC 27448 TaxID=1240678 RepID=A0A0D7CTE6_9ACTN|nr:copper chaperone PCu(A)C [Streptomyces natalensis]KIZ19306.1 copper chaperone [Streptomyces natalensis ATCC 27448]